MTEAMAIDDFVAWFKAEGGWIDESAMSVTEIQGMGMGALALRDIDVSLRHSPKQTFF